MCEHCSYTKLYPSAYAFTQPFAERFTNVWKIACMNTAASMPNDSSIACCHTITHAAPALVPIHYDCCYRSMSPSMVTTTFMSVPALFTRRSARPPTQMGQLGVPCTWSLATQVQTSEVLVFCLNHAIRLLSESHPPDLF